MPAVDSLGDLNSRYEQQSTWTRGTREHLFGLARLGPASRVLDIGCGTGAVAQEILSTSDGIRLTGVDIDLGSLRFARRRSALLPLAAGDAHALPFGDGSFDAVFFHFVLLWLREPARALAEAARVTRPGGYVIAIAEPDHEGRIDAPEALEALGRLQTESLRRQGADVRFGRKLPALLAAAGLVDVRFGVIGGEWRREQMAELIESEWSMLRSDFGALSPGAPVPSPAELARLERQDREAWAAGTRVLFVPTMWGMGRVEARRIGH
jgi:SAM-dependent methyltransferase